MSETRQYNLEKAAAAVAAYISQGPALYEVPLADLRNAVDDAQAGGPVPMPDVEETWVKIEGARSVGERAILLCQPFDEPQIVGAIERA